LFITNPAVFAGGWHNLLMPRLRPDSKRLPDIPGGEGWLSNELQQQLVHFQSAGNSADGELIALRTFQWKPPYPPVPLSRRRMLRHQAVDNWDTNREAGWQRCYPPVR
jgi:hypothetical protein